MADDWETAKLDNPVYLGLEDSRDMVQKVIARAEGSRLGLKSCLIVGPPGIAKTENTLYQLGLMGERAHARWSATPEALRSPRRTLKDPTSGKVYFRTPYQRMPPGEMQAPDFYCQFYRAAGPDEILLLDDVILQGTSPRMLQAGLDRTANWVRYKTVKKLPEPDVPPDGYKFDGGIIFIANPGSYKLSEAQMNRFGAKVFIEHNEAAMFEFIINTAFFRDPSSGIHLYMRRELGFIGPLEEAVEMQNDVLQFYVTQRERLTAHNYRMVEAWMRLRMIFPESWQRRALADRTVFRPYKTQVQNIVPTIADPTPHLKP